MYQDTTVTLLQCYTVVPRYQDILLQCYTAVPRYQDTLYWLLCCCYVTLDTKILTVMLLLCYPAVPRYQHIATLLQCYMAVPRNPDTVITLVRCCNVTLCLRYYNATLWYPDTKILTVTLRILVINNILLCIPYIPNPKRPKITGLCIIFLAHSLQAVDILEVNHESVETKKVMGTNHMHSKFT